MKEYAIGFIKRATEYGFSVDQGEAILKAALEDGQPPQPMPEQGQELPPELAGGGQGAEDPLANLSEEEIAQLAQQIIAEMQQGESPEEAAEQQMVPEDAQMLEQLLAQQGITGEKAAAYKEGFYSRAAEFEKSANVSLAGLGKATGGLGRTAKNLLGAAGLAGGGYAAAKYGPGVVEGARSSIGEKLQELGKYISPEEIKQPGLLEKLLSNPDAFNALVGGGVGTGVGALAGGLATDDEDENSSLFKNVGLGALGGGMAGAGVGYGANSALAQLSKLQQNGPRNPNPRLPVETV